MPRACANWNGGTGTVPQSSHGFLGMSTKWGVFLSSHRMCVCIVVPQRGSPAWARGAPGLQCTSHTGKDAEKLCRIEEDGGIPNFLYVYCNLTISHIWRFAVIIKFLTLIFWYTVTRVCIFLQSKSPAISESNDQFSIDGSTMDDDAFSYVNLDLIGPNYNE